MTETDNNASEHDTSGIAQWYPSDEYNGYFAFLHNGKYSKLHIVETTTFDNSAMAPSDYSGHSASIGEADSLCGRHLTGQMIPLEQDGKHINGICGSCLRSLRKYEANSDTNHKKN